MNLTENTPRILIVEDNALTAEALRRLLTEAGYRIAGRLSRGEELADWLSENDADLLLMDINLEGKLTGIEAVAGLNQHLRWPVIFLSAFQDQPTLEAAFNTQPAAYLTKPYKNVDILNAVRLTLSKRQQTVLPEAGFVAAEDESSVKGIPRDSLMVKAGKQFKRILAEDIRWIRADGSYTEIHTADEKYLVVMSIGTLLERLNHPNIQRVHRSYALNVKAVSGFDANFAYLGEVALPITRAAYQELKAYFI